MFWVSFEERAQKIAPLVFISVVGAAFETIPDSRAAVAEAIFLLPKGDLRRFSTSNHSRANLVVLSGEAGSASVRALETRIRGVIRAGASPRHVPAKIIPVADIPRTLNGKIAELAVRNVIEGRPVKNREALANPEALDLYKDLPDLQT